MKWRDIKGWLSDAEGLKLQELAKGKEVLEFGCWRGKSAVCMAEVAKHVTTVDHFRGDAFAGRRAKLSDAMTTMVQVAEKCSNISIFSASFDYAVTRLQLGKFDFFYYDADHTYEATRMALTVLEPYVSEQFKPLAIHDYDGKGSPNFEGVKRAVDEAVEVYGLKLEVVDTLAVLTKEIPF